MSNSNQLPVNNSLPGTTHFISECEADGCRLGLAVINACSFYESYYLWQGGVCRALVLWVKPYTPSEKRTPSCEAVSEPRVLAKKLAQVHRNSGVLCLVARSVLSLRCFLWCKPVSWSRSMLWRYVPPSAQGPQLWLLQSEVDEGSFHHRQSRRCTGCTHTRWTGTFCEVWLWPVSLGTGNKYIYSVSSHRNNKW